MCKRGRSGAWAYMWRAQANNSQNTELSKGLWCARVSSQSLRTRTFTRPEARMYSTRPVTGVTAVSAIGLSITRNGLVLCNGLIYLCTCKGRCTHGYRRMLGSVVLWCWYPNLTYSIIILRYKQVHCTVVMMLPNPNSTLQHILHIRTVLKNNQYFSVIIDC